MKQLRLICFAICLVLLCSCQSNIDPFTSKGGDNTIGFYCNGEKYIQLYQTLPFGSAHKSVYAWREDDDILIFSYVIRKAYDSRDCVIEALGFCIPGHHKYEKGDIIHLSGDQIMVICTRNRSDNDSSAYEADDAWENYERLSPASRRQYLFPVNATIRVKRYESKVLLCDFEIEGNVEKKEGDETLLLTKGVCNVGISMDSDFPMNTDIPKASEDYHKLHELYCEYIEQTLSFPAQ